jgi:hypothetical protein
VVEFMGWLFLPLAINFFFLWKLEKHDHDMAKKHFGELYKQYEKLGKKYEKEQRKNIAAGIKERFKKQSPNN